jgi:hypothetical protein
MRLTRLSVVSAVLLFTTFMTLSCSRLSNPFGGGAPELFPIQQDGKWGYINSKGEVVVQPQFVEAWVFSEGLAVACIERSKCGYIDETGKFSVNPQFSTAMRFSDGLAAVEVEGKIGYIDKTGKLVVNPQFETVGRMGGRLGLATFSEGMARVKSGDKFGFIDKTGKVVITPQFEDAFPFFEGLAAVSVGKKYGFVDGGGKLVVNPQFDEAQPFTNGLACVRVGKQYGYIDKTGKLTINPQFDVAFPFSDEGLAMVGLGGKVGYIDKSGKYVVNPQFDFQKLGPGEWGSEAWQLLFLFTPDIGRGSFSDGLTPARAAEGKVGYVDKTGKFVINPQFDLALPFYGGMAFVVIRVGDTPAGETMAWIDKDGKFVWRETKEQPKTDLNMNAANANTTMSNANASVSANVNTSVNTNSSGNMNSSANTNTSSPIASGGGKTGHLTMDANLRSDPNKDSASMGIHFRGAQVRVIEQTSYVRDNEVTTWYKIHVYKYGCSNNANLGCGKNAPSDVDEGWVNAKLVLLD